MLAQLREFLLVTGGFFLFVALTAFAYWMLKDIMFFQRPCLECTTKYCNGCPRYTRWYNRKLSGA